MSVGIIIILVLALLLVIFTLQNTAVITLKVLFWEVSDVPLVLALMVCLISGFIIAYALLYPKVWKLKSQVKNLKKQVEEPIVTVPQPEQHSTSEGIEMSGDTDESFFKD